MTYKKIEQKNLFLAENFNLYKIILKPFWSSKALMQKSKN